MRPPSVIFAAFARASQEAPDVPEFERAVCSGLWDEWHWLVEERGLFPVDGPVIGRAADDPTAWPYGRRYYVTYRAAGLVCASAADAEWHRKALPYSNIVL